MAAPDDPVPGTGADPRPATPGAAGFPISADPTPPAAPPVPAAPPPPPGPAVPDEPRASVRRPMTERARTLWAGGLVSLVLVALGAAIPVPFVALGPGSTFNTIASAQGHQVITFSGDDIPAAAAEQPTGHLNMLTIRIVDKIPMFEAVGMWVSGQYQFAPREEYFPPNKSVQQVNEENRQMFTDSQSAAEIEALRYLGYPNVVYVGDITSDSPSWHILQPKDQITEVDGKPVTDYQSLAGIMSGTHPDQKVAVTVRRDGEPVTATITLGANPKVGPQGFLGVGVVERPVAPFSINIALEDIGGPSAGLMFTLGIIDRLTPGDLSGGKFIAGTGTINVQDGSVGAIGGVTLKERTARSAGAQYMLVPADNCAEALTDVPDGLTLVKVSTLDDAVQAVKTIAAGGTPPSCSTT